MAGITDMPFRRLMKHMGAGVVVSEFVSAHAIVQKSVRSEQYLRMHSEEFPVGIQIFGGDDDVLAEAARIVESKGASFVDINMGCPVPKVTKKGGGSAWLCQVEDLPQMLSKVRAAIQIPLTIKIRLGWDSSSLRAMEICKIAHNEGVEMVAVHGRTRAQGYAGSADWSAIQELALESKVPIVGNGDLVSGPLAAARLLESGCAGVMIGRGALKNPWIFLEAMEALTKMKTISDELSRQQVVQGILDHHKVPPAGEVPEGKDYYQKKVKKLQPMPVNFTAQWIRIRADRDAARVLNMHLGFLREIYPEQRAMLNFRKFLAWYSAGYPGSHQFRKFIFTTQDFEQIWAKTLEFFESVKAAPEAERDALPVLMDGHG